MVLDLFSCTGNIGLEFLSRGAKKAYLSEFDKHNLRLMQENIEHTKFTDQAVIMPGDFRKNLGQIRENIDYVYLDPPYKSEYYENSFELMLKSDFFKGTLFIVEVDADIDFSKTFDQLEIVYEKKYGRKYIRFYREK